MRVIRTNIPFLPPRGFKAIAIGRFIFVRNDTEVDYRLLRHEATHWAQEKELLFVGFYLLYLFKFLIRLLRLGNWHSAYRSISFEREARLNEDALLYNQNRRHFAWLAYIDGYGV